MMATDFSRPKCLSPRRAGPRSSSNSLSRAARRSPSNSLPTFGSCPTVCLTTLLPKRRRNNFRAGLVLAEVGADIAWRLFRQSIAFACRIKFALQHVPARQPKDQRDRCEDQVKHQGEHNLREQPSDRKRQSHPGDKKPANRPRFHQAQDPKHQRGGNQRDANALVSTSKPLMRAERGEEDQPRTRELAQSAGAGISIDGDHVAGFSKICTNSTARLRSRLETRSL